MYATSETLSSITALLKSIVFQVFAINNQFPGPLINVTEGDTVVVRVTNTVPRDSISLHFHGLSMKGHPEMDGAAGFTQVRL
jgi:FtsP/CotA-like multicopper oxidase with cupredoxin domain